MEAKRPQYIQWRYVGMMALAIALVCVAGCLSDPDATDGGQCDTAERAGSAAATVIAGSSFLPIDPAYSPAKTGPCVGFQADDINAVAGVALPTGATVTSIRVRVRDSSAPVRLQAMFHSTDATGSIGAISSTSDSAGDGSAQTLTLAGTTILAGHAYSIQVLRDGPNTGACHIYSAEVDWY